MDAKSTKRLDDVRAIIKHVTYSLGVSSNPFEGILELPEDLAEVVNSCGPALVRIEEERLEVGRELVRSLFLVLDSGLKNRRLPVEALLRRGVPLRPPRDELELLADGLD